MSFKILYSEELPTKLIESAWTIGVISSFTVLLTPPRVYTSLMPPYEVCAVAQLLF